MNIAEEHYMHHQADQLAASILLPEQEFLKIWQGCLDPYSVAEIFEVPIKAVIIRLEMLGIHI